MAEVTAVTTVYPYAVLLSFLLSQNSVTEFFGNFLEIFWNKFSKNE